MKFQTKVDIASSGFKIGPCERMLFVGSCFADSMGRRFEAEKFRCEVNPFGVMYNPASILHTVEHSNACPRVAVLTLGTNHVYILRSTGEIVDNCAKRPQSLFEERELSIDECADYISKAISVLRARDADVRIIITVSPIRYAKYGFHESQLSKSTLLLAADKVVRESRGVAEYFPAYEIVNDELRDYRFYAADMLHPSEQAVEYIYERFSETYFSSETFAFMKEWQPLRRALAHRPFDAESEEYKRFIEETKTKIRQLAERYPDFEM